MIKKQDDINEEKNARGKQSSNDCRTFHSHKKNNPRLTLTLF